MFNMSFIIYKCKDIHTKRPILSQQNPIDISIQNTIEVQKKHTKRPFARPFIFRFIRLLFFKLINLFLYRFDSVS